MLWHTLLDAVVVYFSRVWAGAEWSLYALEGLVALFSVLSIAIIFALRQPEPVETQPMTLDAPAPLIDASELAEEEQEVRPEDLDSTRFA